MSKPSQIVKKQAPAPVSIAQPATKGKGKQQLRDLPQSVSVVTEKLIDDRNLDESEISITAGSHNHLRATALAPAWPWSLPRPGGFSENENDSGRT